MSKRLRWLAVALLFVGAVIVLSFAVNGQETSVVGEILETVVSMDGIHFPLIGDLMEALNQDPEIKAEFMFSPREYLATQTLVSSPIILENDAFQVTVFDLGKESEIIEGEEAVDTHWFTIAEPLEHLGYKTKGIGFLYEHIGMFIQETKEIFDDEVTIERTVDGEMITYLETITGLTDEVLDELRVAIRDLNGLGLDDTERFDFLSNPRQYIYDKTSITLPAASYRIIAIDFDRAAELEVVTRGETRPGLVVVPEGIGEFFDNVGIFIQQAK